jgi:uncharacterized protein YecE (DUF72 family)
MRALVGTSGYNYDAWKGSFYPDDLAKKKMLSYYASRFPTVEINYTFYRKPTEKALRGWSGETPENFRFVLKGWQRITHQKRLLECEPLVASFWEVAQVLGDKLGPILFQLPPNFKKDLPRLDAFLALLPPAMRAAFEFRHATWFSDDVFSSLRGKNAALCVAESEELATPLVRTAPFGYLRLRREDYDDAAIARWAKLIAEAGFTDDVHVFFKHEDGAKGTKFADALIAKLK